MTAPEQESPIALASERTRNTARDAAIWLGLAGLIWLGWTLAPLLLLIVGGCVFAAGLQGAEMALGKVWKAPRPLRMTVVIIAVVALLVWFGWFTAVQLDEQYGQLRQRLGDQLAALRGWAAAAGLDLGRFGTNPAAALQEQLAGSLGQLTDALGSVAGALGSLFFVIMFGIYLAADPNTYARGLAWLTPRRHRAAMTATVAAMGRTLRRWVAGRLLVMTIEGAVMAVGLWLAGVPLAGLLGLLTGLLAFIPTLGAVIAGVLIVMVGFSAGGVTAFWAFVVYLGVQFLEGNILTPLVEKRVVALAPAVVLAAQLLFGVTFGILGVALADPIVALAKTALAERSRAAAPAAARSVSAV